MVPTTSITIQDPSMPLHILPGALARDRVARALLCAALTACAAAPTPLAPRGSADAGIRRTLVGQHPVVGLPGWETRVYLIEYPPGAAAPPHVHPAAGIGYVIEGRFVSAFGAEAEVEVGAGRGFVDQAGAVHRVFRNPDREHGLRFLVAYTLREGDPPLRPAP
jgi:quercetin dioxygenase-like cupin family protein